MRSLSQSRQRRDCHAANYTENCAPCIHRSAPCRLPYVARESDDSSRALLLTPHKCLDGSERLVCLACRRDAVSPHTCRHNKCLSVVDDERLERILGTLHGDLFTFNQVQHIQCAGGVVLDRCGEPMSSRFEELKLVQAGCLFAPPVTMCDLAHGTDKVVRDPLPVTIPLDIGKAMLQVNRARQAI